MKNQAISNVFNEIADLLEIKGENTFRIRAYRRAAQNVEGLPDDVSKLSKKELLEIPGIGHDLAEKILEYVSTGKVSSLEELKKQVPGDIVSLLSVPGLGPKTVKLLHDKLKIKNMDELELLAREHKLSGLPGIKEKTEENIIKGIELIKRGIERRPLGFVLPIANDIFEHLKKNKGIQKISIAGSLRRRKDTIKDIDMLAASSNPQDVMKEFVRLPHVKDVLMHGPTKSSIVTQEGIQVDLRVVDDESFGAALAYFTGSKEHNIRLREMAVKKGLKINEYGIFREEDNKKLGGKEESDIYKILGLQYVPPEMREDTGEIEAAMHNALPKLIELKDIKGDLHVHTKESDGNHTLEELVDGARAKGYEYIAITDHSKGLGIANGLNEERVMEEKKEIDALNKKLKGFKILFGIEVDIKSDNKMDFANPVLSEMDIVVASIHSGFKQSREQLTQRIVSAMKNPYVSVIAHPTGRLIGERDPYEIDMDYILKTAKETGTAIEINAYPLRLDLSDIYVKKGKELGVKFVISTDTHLVSHFDYMSYGVSVARRGWLEKKDVLNTLDYEQLMKMIERKKNKKNIFVI
jgi:DNA polymerase (family 10)